MSRFVAGIQSYVNAGLLPNEANATATFQQMDSLFNILNSSFIHAQPGKEAITPENLEEKIAELENNKNWVNSWTFRNNKEYKRVMPFRQGWCITIESVIRVTKQCFDVGFAFLGTRRLNQDCLEVSTITMPTHTHGGILYYKRRQWEDWATFIL